MDRRAFWVRAFISGWDWFLAAFAAWQRPFGPLLTLLGLFGVPTALLALLGVPLLGVLLGIALVVVLCLAEGAYRVSRDGLGHTGGVAVVAMDASLMIETKPGPDSGAVPMVFFDTMERTDYVVKIAGRPQRLVFFPPAETRKRGIGRRKEQRVDAAELPKLVRRGGRFSRRLLTVKRFVDAGFSVDEWSKREQIVVEWYPMVDDERPSPR